MESQDEREDVDQTEPHHFDEDQDVDYKICGELCNFELESLTFHLVER